MTYMTDDHPLLRRPILIVGTGRCGSTMLHRLIALHADVGWLSTLNEAHPTQAWLSVCSKLYRSNRFTREIKHKRYFPKPFEAYEFWEHFLPGFSRRDKPQTAEDVYAEGIDPVRRAVAQVMKYQGGERFLAKVTGWSRMAYFDRIFPDAMFVFLNREPRGVVSSWIQAGWLDVTSSPESDTWQWGPVPEPYFQLWKELGGSPILSAALKIQMDLDDIRANVAQFPQRSFELQYEDLVTQPNSSLRALCEFTDLPWTAQFEGVIDAMPFYNPKDKWRKHLSEDQGELILEFFRRAGSEEAGTAAISGRAGPQLVTDGRF
jgi:hypothetical protein